MLWWLVTFLWLTTFEHSHAQGTVSLDFNVTENATIGTEVGRLQESGVAGGYILTSDESSPFRTHFDVNLLQDQGILLTIKALDHEEYSQFDEVAYDSIKNNYIQVGFLKCYFPQVVKNSIYHKLVKYHFSLET